MTEIDPQDLSASRLRIGVCMLVIWWIPFWAATPLFASMLGITSSEGKHELTVAIMIIQTVIGLLGVVVAGRQVKLIMRNTSVKKLPGKVWGMLRSGQVD